MQVLNKRSTFALFFALSALTHAAELDLLHGHFEIQADYVVGTGVGSGWWLGPTYNQNDDFNDRSQIRRLNAAETRIVAPPRSRTLGTNTTTFLLPVGEPLWLLSQAFQVGNHFLGMRVIADPLIFQTRVGSNYTNTGSGTISMRLLSVTGSGPDRGGKFALWESQAFAGQVVYFNSNDGITTADEIPTLPVGTHSHFSWGFTKPGEYKVTIEAYGRLRPSGTHTSRTETFTFIVPHGGNVSSLDARLCRAGDSLALITGDASVGIAYGPRRSFVEVLTAATSGPPGAAWQCPLRFGADAWVVPDYAGLTTALGTTGADSGSGATLKLTGHRGPGHVIATTTTGATLFDSSNGIGVGDEVDLGAGPINGTLYFTEQGVHTLEFAGASLGATGSGLVVRCGAGLPITYTFANWADSYERAHGLTAGALASISGDYNGDSRTHGLEYLLDVAGLDPVIGGSVGHVQIESAGDFGRMIFMRDLYKDTLLGSGLQLQSGFSENLTDWTFLSASFVGYPLEFFETGAEEGNARSLLMNRALRNKVPTSGRGFFRLRSR